MMGPMASGSRHVLVVATEPTVLDRVAPMLRRQEFEVHTVADTPFVLDLVLGTPFELLIVSFPPAGISTADLVAAVRNQGSACRTAGLLLLARPERIEMAMRWLDRGVNRIVSTDWSEARLWQAVGDLLEVAPRFDLRVLVEVEVQMAHGGRCELARSVNVSRSGLLLTSELELAPGTPFDFTFFLPRGTEPVRGRGEIVRRTSADREGVDGYGARVVRWKGDSEVRLAEYLHRASRKV